MRGRCRRHYPVLHHPGRQPFADQTDHAPVADAVFQGTDQPFVAERVEEPRNIGVQYPVYLRAGDPGRQRVQRIVLAAPRPEPIREPEEVCLVDRVQHLDNGPLDNLVLQRRDAERPHPPVRLGYVVPS